MVTNVSNKFSFLLGPIPSDTKDKPQNNFVVSPYDGLLQPERDNILYLNHSFNNVCTETYKVSL